MFGLVVSGFDMFDFGKVPAARDVFTVDCIVVDGSGNASSSRRAFVNTNTTNSRGTTYESNRRTSITTLGVRGAVFTRSRPQ